MRQLLVLLIALAPFVSFAQDGYQVGEVAENFNLKNVDGTYVSLAHFSSAKGVIIVFTCNTCPVAKAYEKRIQSLDQRFRDKGFPVLAINPNDVGQSPGDSFEEMKKRAAQKNYAFPYLIDEDQSVTRRFGATRTPQIYLLENVEGKQKIRYIGAIDNNQNGDPDTKYVEVAVNALLNGQAPATSFTKAVGCSIKFKKVQ